MLAPTESSPVERTTIVRSVSLDPSLIKLQLYTTVSEADTKQLRRVQGVKEERQLLQKIFELDKGEHNPKVTELLLDFHLNNLRFVKHTMNFSDEKVSTILGIMNHTLLTALLNNMSQRESLQIFRALMKVHSFPRPPDSIGLFGKEDNEVLEEFFLKTFYRHFPLYETAIKQKAELTLRTHQVIEVGRPGQASISGDMKEAGVEDAPVLVQLLAAHQMLEKPVVAVAEPKPEGEAKGEDEGKAQEPEEKSA